MSCPICCETFTAAKRRPVQCPFCPSAACVECCQKYILDSGNADAACMSCRTPWNREFLSLNFSKAFISRDYKSHREQVLFEREYALLPASQHMVEHWRRAQTLREEIPGMVSRIAELKRELADLTARRMRATNELDIIMAHEYHRGANVDGEVPAQQERRQFIKACPADNCRGFLSTAWKCGTCNVRVCPDCHVIKVADEDHACNPDDVATATLLRRDTKPCPSCATMITKIDGCFARDTVIPMYDGTFKMSQDIYVGDLLIGDDGNPRKVIDTCRGTDDLYEISQKNGISYIVNSKHKLVLKFSGECVPHWSTEQNAWKAWRFDQSSLKRKFIISETRENIKEIPGIYEITIDDFLKMSPSLQKDAMGFKSLGADWDTKPVIVDLVSRKKCMPSRENKDNLRTGIFVEKIEKGEYFGWSLDGNKRFVLSDFTVVRNCDQMWCTQCHTAFSWRTGAIETSVVHNPHYYEWQRRQNGGVAPRVPGDVPGGNNDAPCVGGAAGLMPLYLMETNPIFRKISNDTKNGLRRAHRLVSHTREVTLRAYRNTRVDNADLRLLYLVGVITEKDWKQKLQQREKKAARNDEARHIFEAFAEVGNIFFGDLLLERATGEEIVKRFADLVAYSNEAIESAEKRFGMKIARVSLFNYL